MSIRLYEPARFYNVETKRFRWAVVCSSTFAYCFPRSRGRAAAERLAKRLNREASE